MAHPGPIWIAGGDGLVGAALRRRLGGAGWTLAGDGAGREPDLHDPRAVDAFLAHTRPAAIVVAAGRSGGIAENQARPATLMHDNLAIACHVLEAARRRGVDRLLYLASSCVYPRDAAQPLAVDALLGGRLEPTCEPYALAKLAGLRLALAFRQEHGVRFVAAILPDVYGPGDDFDATSSHVVPALLRRFAEARAAGADAVTLWGTGRARRDFVYVDDVADACRLVLERWDDPTPINLGSGREVAIAALAEAVRDVTGFAGAIRFDATKPDGAPRKALDGAAIAALGWRPRTTLRDGLAKTLAWWGATARPVAARPAAGPVEEVAT